MAFSSSEDAILCELVGQHPCLFDFKNPNYKDHKVCENVWAEIAEITGKPVDSCKNRWKNFRDTYNRNKRGKKLRTGSSSQAKPSKWVLGDVLSFLASVSQERESLTNTPLTGSVDPPLSQTEKEVQDDDKDEQAVTEEASTCSITTLIKSTSLGDPQETSKKRKRKEEEKILCILEVRLSERKDILKRMAQSTPTTEEDDTDVFFRSIALTVKSLPPTLIAAAKRSICNLVMDLEIQALSNTQTQLSPADLSVNNENNNN